MTEHEADLDWMLAAARRNPPRPGAALMGRIAADAERHSPVRGWRRVWAVMGGFPAMESFVGAALAGLWIGVAQPGPVESFFGTQDYEMADLMPGYDADWDDSE